MNRICRWLVVICALSSVESASARERFFFRKPAPPCCCPTEPRAVTPVPSVKVEAIVAEKLNAFNFVNASWKEVLAWLAKESGLIFLSTENPTGTLTLSSESQYTLPQLIDLLNEVLEHKNWVVIRREHSFLIHPANVKIPREILHQITLEELETRGNTEVVQIVIPLKTRDAGTVLPQAKQLLSQYGDATAFGMNRLIVLDKAKNIKNIVALLANDIDDPTSVVTSQWKTYEFPSGTAEATAKKILDTPLFKWSGVKTLIIGSEKVMIYGTPADHDDIAAFLKPPVAIEVTVPTAPWVACPPPTRTRLFARFR